jgi:hypothetical protein
MRPLASGRSNLCLLGHLQGIVYLNTQVANGDLQLCVPKQLLDCAKVLCSAVDQRGLSTRLKIRT